MILLALLLFGVATLIYWPKKQNWGRGQLPPKTPIQVASITPMPTASPTPTPMATASAIVKRLGFAEMNKAYGPCVNLPVIMYHHVEDMKKAIKEGHGSLTVDTTYFRKHLEYLKSHGYTFVTTSELEAFFDGKGQLPSKPVMLSFDDGYVDNYTDAFPVMKELGAKGVLFLPTGLTNNPGYLTWDNIAEMNSSGVFTFGNHTWSHMNVGGKKEIVQKEITTADKQLSERGLNLQKVFAYPYGLENGFAVGILKNMGYGLAFTTQHGSIECAKQRLSLPRIRVGNTSLLAYGF